MTTPNRAVSSTPEDGIAEAGLPSSDRAGADKDLSTGSGEEALDRIEFHGGCDQQRCRICLQHSDLLLGELIRLTGDTSVSDLLGEYHGWLGRAGIAPETDGGWWTREALSDANARRFATDRAGFRRPLEHCQCPACMATIHSSDCAVHNMPAMPNGPCDCGAACEAAAGSAGSNEKAPVSAVSPLPLSMSMFATSADYWRAMYEARDDSLVLSHQRLSKALRQIINARNQLNENERVLLLDGLFDAAREALASIPKEIQQ